MNTPDNNDLDQPHDITVTLEGSAQVVRIQGVHFDGLTRQRIIVATEQATGGTVNLLDGHDGEPVVTVNDSDGAEVARGAIQVTPSTI